MAFTFNGLTGTTVTINGSVAAALPEDASTQTIVHAQVSLGTTNLTTVYTVPADKVFYVTAIGCSASTGGWLLFKDNAGNEIWRIGGNDNTSYTPAQPFMKMAATEVIQAQCQVATCQAWVSGYLVDA